MPEDANATGRTARKWLLTQNSDLRRIGVFNWTLPAFVIEMPDGSHFNVCPQAGECAKFCYARVGTYRFKNVRAAHIRNLLLCRDTPGEFERRMTDELSHKRYSGKWIRLHDSGEFFSGEYLLTWIRIMRNSPGVRFYCYTKEISLFKRLVVNDAPENFLWCYSLGGKEDHLIDVATERHADVFPDVEALIARGYTDQTESDLLSVLSESPRVGIPANRIRHLLKMQGQKTFGEHQRERDEKLRAKKMRADQKFGLVR
ncbi:GP88 family protein [Streptomyces sp. NBC_00073]|uniref:GP88 family protein n=1 Tax=Streptomyces sp. NBC_00073 TaxID=2975640 RepID=UPI002F908767